MAVYVIPQVQVFQEFGLAPTAITEPLRACIVGPQYHLRRYSESDEKLKIKVTESYEPDADESFVWPDRPAGGVVDTTYTRVYMDDALLCYYTDPVGSGSEIRVVSGYRNRIRFADLVLQTKNGYDRSAAFKERDVAAGDVLDITASACGEAFNIRTRILGFVAEVVAAIIGDAEADEDNAATQAAGVTYEQTAGYDNLVCIEDADESLYDGRADGQVTETYIVEVTRASTGGNAETGKLRVTAQSGTEGPFEVTPAAFGNPTAIGGRGLTVTWDNNGCGQSSSSSGVPDQDDFLVGQKWSVTVRQDYVAPAPTSGGTYLGAPDTTYIAEVTKGGDVGTAQVTVSTSTGVDASGPTTIEALGTAVPIGTQGVTLTFAAATEGFCKGDRFTVAVEARGEGAIKTAVIAHPLPPELRGICEVDLGGGSSSSSSGTPPDLGVTFYIEKNIEVPANRTNQAPLVNWEQSATEITLKRGITAYDASWTEDGVMLALPVRDGAVYVHYRALVQQWIDKVGTITDVSEIADVFDDAPEIDPDNLLVFGVYNALLNANGTPVKFTSVGSSSPIELEDWTEALEVLRGRDDVYSLVPLSQDKQVLDAFVGHVNAMSTPEIGRWRIAWLNMVLASDLAVYTRSEAVGAGDSDPVLATIKDDPETSGTQYTLVTADNEKFLTGDQDVKVGDIVRCRYTDDGFGVVSYEEYVVDAILNEEQLRLYSGPSAAVNTPSKIEIWRDLSKTEQAAEQAKKPGLFDARRAYMIWPDEVGNAGVTVPGYFLCCSLAGLRSASLPHRPLTNVEITGWDDLSKTTDYFTDTQLNTLAAAGYWIVTQDPKDGDVYTRHQLSTNNLDLNRREQSVTTNLDSVSYLSLRRLAPYIGRGNLTAKMLSIVEGEVLAILDYFSNTVTKEILGPQIETYTIKELKRHPLLKDRMLITVEVGLPYPLNSIDLHFVV